jgi:pimeloyl-ACP methyl ester carboxylesterase
LCPLPWLQAERPELGDRFRGGWLDGVRHERGNEDREAGEAAEEGCALRTCPSPPYLVGHLLGGAIGARFAIAHSEKLRGLVLLDTFGLCPLRPSPLFTLR